MELLADEDDGELESSGDDFDGLRVTRILTNSLNNPLGTSLN
jgi:hypothetical protein